MTFDDLE